MPDGRMGPDRIFGAKERNGLNTFESRTQGALVIRAPTTCPLSEESHRSQTRRLRLGRFPSPQVVADQLNSGAVFEFHVPSLDQRLDQSRLPVIPWSSGFLNDPTGVASTWNIRQPRADAARVDQSCWRELLRYPPGHGTLAPRQQESRPSDLRPQARSQLRSLKGEILEASLPQIRASCSRTRTALVFVATTISSRPCAGIRPRLGQSLIMGLGMGLKRAMWRFAAVTSGRSPARLLFAEVDSLSGWPCPRGSWRGHLAGRPRTPGSLVNRRDFPLPMGPA